MMEKEKRGYPRAQVKRPARIRVGEEPESNTQLIDISEAGATLFYPSPVVIGAAVELRFHLNTGMRTECLAYGQIRHYSVRGQSHVIGVSFTHFMPETVETIREFVLLKMNVDNSRR